jgi:hypothetical protein
MDIITKLQTDADALDPFSVAVDAGKELIAARRRSLAR